MGGPRILHVFDLPLGRWGDFKGWYVFQLPGNNGIQFGKERIVQRLDRPASQTAQNQRQYMLIFFVAWAIALWHVGNRCQFCRIDCSQICGKHD